jgi:hypothetical protein
MSIDPTVLLSQVSGLLGALIGGGASLAVAVYNQRSEESLRAAPTEAVIEEVAEGTERPDLIHGRYLLKLEARTLDDIRRLGANSEEDNKRFATVARLSEINNGLYRMLVRPMVKAMVTDSSAETVREMHSHRMRFSLLSDRNPFIAPIQSLVGAQGQTGRGSGEERADRQIAPSFPTCPMTRSSRRLRRW